MPKEKNKESKYMDIHLIKQLLAMLRSENLDDTLLALKIIENSEKSVPTSHISHFLVSMKNIEKRIYLRRYDNEQDITNGIKYFRKIIFQPGHVSRKYRARTFARKSA